MNGLLMIGGLGLLVYAGWPYIVAWWQKRPAAATVPAGAPPPLDPADPKAEARLGRNAAVDQLLSAADFARDHVNPETADKLLAELPALAKSGEGAK